MARNDNSGDKGKVRVRVIDFEMEGSNQTLRESIRDMVTAIGRTSPSVRIVRPASLPPSSAASTSESQANDDSEFVEEPDTRAEAAAEDASSATSARARTAPRSPLVLDLDLNSGDQPIKKYLLRFNPDSDANRYLLIAYWFKNFYNTPEVTMDHVHTAYRLMGWSTPRDAAVPLRDMKKRGWFKKGSGKGAYAINHVGENRVMEFDQPDNEA